MGSGDPQRSLQAAVVQARVFLYEQGGEQVGGTAGGTNLPARAHGKRAARDSVGKPHKAQQLVIHEARQVGIITSDSGPFHRATCRL